MNPQSFPATAVTGELPDADGFYDAPPDEVAEWINGKNFIRVGFLYLADGRVLQCVDFRLGNRSRHSPFHFSRNADDRTTALYMLQGYLKREALEIAGLEHMPEPLQECLESWIAQIHDDSNWRAPVADEQPTASYEIPPGWEASTRQYKQSPLAGVVSLTFRVSLSPEKKIAPVINDMAMATKLLGALDMQVNEIAVDYAGNGDIVVGLVMRCDEFKALRAGVFKGVDFWNRPESTVATTLTFRVALPSCKKTDPIIQDAATAIKLLSALDMRVDEITFSTAGYGDVVAHLLLCATEFKELREGVFKGVRIGASQTQPSEPA